MRWTDGVGHGRKNPLTRQLLKKLLLVLLLSVIRWIHWEQYWYLSKQLYSEYLVIWSVSCSFCPLLCVWLVASCWVLPLLWQLLLNLQIFILSIVSPLLFNMSNIFLIFVLRVEQLIDAFMFCAKIYVSCISSVVDHISYFFCPYSWAHKVSIRVKPIKYMFPSRSPPPPPPKSQHPFSSFSRFLAFLLLLLLVQLVWNLEWSLIRVQLFTIFL